VIILKKICGEDTGVQDSLLAELMKLPVKSSDARVPVLSLPEDSTAWALSEKTNIFKYKLGFRAKKVVYFTIHHARYGKIQKQ
jgi:hypothetical protein